MCNNTHTCCGGMNMDTIGDVNCDMIRLRRVVIVIRRVVITHTFHTAPTLLPRPVSMPSEGLSHPIPPFQAWGRSES